MHEGKIDKVLLTIKKTVYNLISRLCPSKNEKIVVTGIFLYTVALSLLTSLRHYGFKTLAFDMGVFLQVFWHTLNGNFMFSQPIGTFLHAPSFLAVHVSPIILLLLPIYAVIQTPYTLLTIQSLVLGLPALYIYKICLTITARKHLSLLFAIGYMLCPATLWANWYDFHLEAFIPLFSSMTYYYYFTGKKVKLVVSALLLLTVFETVAFIVVSFIIYFLLREIYIRKRYRQIPNFIKSNMVRSLCVLFGLAFLSLTYFLMCENLMNYIWPQRNLLEPPRIFGDISYDNLLLKLSYIMIFTAPFAFLSFESPLELIPAFPYLFLALCTDYKPYFMINWQYPALISVPFVISSIFGSLGQHHTRRIYIKLVASTLLFLVLATPLSPLMVQFSDDWRVPIPTTEILLKHQALSFIEANASVLAQENIFPQIAERRVAYVIWPEDLDPPDYIVIDVLNWRFYRSPIERPFTDEFFDFISKYNYGVLAIANGLIVLKRDYNDLRKMLMPLHMSLELNSVHKHFISFEDSVQETHFFVPDWVKVKDNSLFLNQSFAGNAWWGPWITVPPGKYRIQVRFSIDREVQGPIMRLLAYHWNPPPIGTKVYAERIIVGEDLPPAGAVNNVTLEFELYNWDTSLEIVGESYGNVNIRIYEVTFEEIE